jgi:hypothetical protein
MRYGPDTFIREVSMDTGFKGAHFKLCHCLRHGRLIGAPGTTPIETGSYEGTDAFFADAERNGAFAPGGLQKARDARIGSLLALKDNGVETGLRERIMLWNLAASATNDPDAFALTDFHERHPLIDDFGQDDPQPA